MKSLEDISDEALRLPDEERASLVHVLMESLEDGGEPDGLLELLEERSREIREGRATFHDPMEIFTVFEQMKRDRRAAQAS